MRWWLRYRLLAGCGLCQWQWEVHLDEKCYRCTRPAGCWWYWYQRCTWPGTGPGIDVACWIYVINPATYIVVGLINPSLPWDMLLVQRNLTDRGPFQPPFKRPACRQTAYILQTSISFHIMGCFVESGIVQHRNIDPRRQYRVSGEQLSGLYVPSIRSV